MDQFQIKTINDITVVKIELVVASVLECFNSMQEAINSNRSESPIRNINFNQEVLLNWLNHSLSIKIGRGFKW